MRSKSVAMVSLACVVPVNGAIVRHFDPPACERCAGHRGVTIATEPGSGVVAVADGTIRFSGEVGGRTYVVLEVSPGVLVTFGGVTAPAPVDSTLNKGEQVATATDSTYLSVRWRGEHREPLRALGIGRVRLVGTGNVAPVGESR
jgi:septal ring factor EnvC (AmiA/AmiB activator)